MTQWQPGNSTNQLNNNPPGHWMMTIKMYRDGGHITNSTHHITKRNKRHCTTVFAT